MESQESPTRASLLESCQTIVVKVGSRVLSQPNGQLDLNQIQSLALQLSKLSAHKEVALVSSGAAAAVVRILDRTDLLENDNCCSSLLEE